MQWDEDAEKELEKVPANVRQMAKMGIESAVGKAGGQRVTRDDVVSAYERVRSMMETDNKTTRIAIVRCDIVSEVCPGTACFAAFNRRKVHFSGYGNAELVGFFTCGGCPGRRIFRLVDSLMKHGVDVIHISSCMLMEKSYAKCPHLTEIKEMISKKGVKLVEGTHH